MDINELQNAAIEAATEHIKGQREVNKKAKIKLYCLTAIVCVLIVCSAVVACVTICAQQETIREQQYALNMQYASLIDYVSGAEVTTETETIDGGDGGTAIKVEGDNNNTAGGDLNG